MDSRRMRLGSIICVIVDSFITKNVELFLSLPIAKPMIPHIPGFGSLLVNVVVHKPRGRGVIRFQWCVGVQFSTIGQQKILLLVSLVSTYVVYTVF